MLILELDDMPRYLQLLEYSDSDKPLMQAIGCDRNAHDLHLLRFARASEHIEYNSDTGITLTDAGAAFLTLYRDNIDGYGNDDTTAGRATNRAVNL